MKRIGYSVMLVGAVLFFMGSLDAAPKKGSAIRISARALLEAYEANEAAADTKFKRKRITVKNGVVGRVGATENGGAVVLIGPGPGGASLRTIISCVMPPKQRRKADTLSKFDVVTVKGKCLGLRILDGLRMVMMNRCSLRSKN